MAYIWKSRLLFLTKPWPSSLATRYQVLGLVDLIFSLNPDASVDGDSGVVLAGDDEDWLGDF